MNILWFGSPGVRGENSKLVCKSCKPISSNKILNHIVLKKKKQGG